LSSLVRSSCRSALEELVGLLHAFAVTELVDIRSVPKSRRNPQFNGDTLGADLGAQGSRYVWLAELGGLRRTRRDSINMAWRNTSFRGYADYMQTEGFELGLDKLHTLAAGQRLALMCAEAVPWRCHRSLVADALTARGASVADISSVKHATPHRMTPFALVEGTRVTYPADDSTGSPLATRGPFNLEATVRVLQRRPTNLVDVWEPEGGYLRALTTDTGVVLVEVTNGGTRDKPDVRFKVLLGDPSAAARAAICQTLRQILGQDVAPGPLQRIAEAEPGLAATARALRGMRPPRFAGLFEAFANVVPFQQLSLDAGVAIVGRLVERFGEAIAHDGRRYYAFPEARVVAKARVDSLRACGLSQRRAEALHQIACAIDSGELSEQDISAMSTADAIQRLSELSGICPWSANLLSLRGLGRLDAFPPWDVGATRGVSDLLSAAPGTSLADVAKRFGAWRGYLYFLSLGAALMARDLIHIASSTSQ